MKASVLDLFIHGNLRVVLKPIIHTVPLVGGVQFYFLNNPSIDFAVAGLANVTDLPGISSILRYPVHLCSLHPPQKSLQYF